jgi:hypothetical protein
VRGRRQKMGPNYLFHDHLFGYIRRKKSTLPPSTFAKTPKPGKKTSLSTFKTVHLTPWPVISGFEGGFIFFFSIYFG